MVVSPQALLQRVFLHEIQYFSRCRCSPGFPQMLLAAHSLLGRGFTLMLLPYYAGLHPHCWPLTSFPCLEQMALENPEAWKWLLGGEPFCHPVHLSLPPSQPALTLPAFPPQGFMSLASATLWCPRGRRASGCRSQPCTVTRTLTAAWKPSSRWDRSTERCREGPGNTSSAPSLPAAKCL